MAAKRKATRRKAPKRTVRRAVKRRAPVAKFVAPNISKELELIAVVGFAILFLYYAVL